MNGDPGDVTELTPAEWQQYLTKARDALHQNPKDREALAAIDQANQMLAAYDAAEAASPGERIRAGVEGGVKGLGQAAVDIPRGVINTALHPVETITNLPKLPSALWHAITSDDPETVARGVGNVGSLLLPFAKTGRAAPVLASARRLAGAPGRTIGALIERPGLTNELLRARLSKLARQAERASQRPTKPDLPTHVADGPLSDIHQAMRDFEAGRISQEDLNAAMEFASKGMGGPKATTLPIEGDVAASAPEITPKISEGPPGASKLRPGEAAEEIPGTGGRGIAITGPRATPAPPTTPTVTEVLEGNTPRQGTLPYYPRGGRAEQAVGARPVRSMAAPLSKTALRTADPGTIATFLKNQMALAEATGSPVTPATLERLLHGIGVTPDRMAAVLKELQTP